jgi:hypothetical protein
MDGEKRRYPPQTQQAGTLAPWGWQGRGFQWNVFFTAKGGLFERPRAAFFNVVADGVMLCMTVVMVGTTRRKTRFPTGVTTSATKAKPPAVATAFCVLSLPYLILEVVAFAIGLLIFLLW